MVPRSQSFDLGKYRAAENLRQFQIPRTTKILETTGIGKHQIVQGTGVKRVAPTAVQYWAPDRPDSPPLLGDGEPKTR